MRNNYTGDTTLWCGVLDVGHIIAINQGGLGEASRLVFSSRWDQTPAILQGNGELYRNIGTGAGQIWWHTSYNGGGFAARGGPLTVTLNSDGQIDTGADNSGWGDQGFELGSPYADNVVTLTNSLRTSSNNIRVWDNRNSANDWAVLAGQITNEEDITKYGDGLLYMTNAIEQLP